MANFCQLMNELMNSAHQSWMMQRHQIEDSRACY
jgi:hypothetical protein